MLSIILIAVLLGFGLRRVRAEQMAAGRASYRAVEDAVDTLLRVTEIALGWVIRLIPLAVFAVVVKSVGEHGYAPLQALLVFVVLGLAGMAAHMLITYQAWLRLFTRVPLNAFWRAAKEPAIYAAGANSSLATLPLTLRALDRLKVPRSASTLGACVGTNFNNDGIILYEGMAVLFVAQASGLDLSLGQQIVAAAACMVAAMGVAGVPEAGIRVAGARARHGRTAGGAPAASSHGRLDHRARPFRRERPERHDVVDSHRTKDVDGFSMFRCPDAR